MHRKWTRACRCAAASLARMDPELMLKAEEHVTVYRGPFCRLTHVAADARMG